jgi:hypothetical protein
VNLNKMYYKLVVNIKVKHLVQLSMLIKHLKRMFILLLLSQQMHDFPLQYSCQSNMTMYMQFFKDCQKDMYTYIDKKLIVKREMETTVVWTWEIQQRATFQSFSADQGLREIDEIFYTTKRSIWSFGKRRQFFFLVTVLY